MSKKTKILIAVKNDVNFKALANMLDMLTRDIEIVFLHIIEFPMPTSLYSEVVSTYVEEARKKLGNLVEWARSQGIGADLRVTASRDVFEAIMTEAEKVEAGMIILQKSSKKIERKIRKLVRRTNLEKVVEASERIVVLLPAD
ncbi:MAG: universal stress protein [Nitrososphaerota archaeon]